MAYPRSFARFAAWWRADLAGLPRWGVLVSFLLCVGALCFVLLSTTSHFRLTAVPAFLGVALTGRIPLG